MLAKKHTDVKQIGGLLLIITSLFLLSACGGSDDNVTSNSEIDDLSDHIGDTKDDVFADLDLEEGKDIDQDEEDIAMYIYQKNTAQFHGEVFKKILYFGAEDDDLIRFGYMKNFDAPEDGYDLFKKINDDLTDDSDLDRYPLQSYEIKDMPDDYADLGMEGASVFDVWRMNDTLDVELEFMDHQEAGATVTIFYGEHPEAREDAPDSFPESD